FSSALPAHRRLPSFPTRRSSDLTSGSRRSCLPGCRLRVAPDHVGVGAIVVRTRTHAVLQLETDAAIQGHGRCQRTVGFQEQRVADRKSTRLNSSHVKISYAVFCL